MARRPRGVTLTELVVVMSLVLIAAAIGFASMQAIRGRSGLRSIALRLLADLRWAREEAMAGHGPAGVLLPATSASQSYAVVMADADAPEKMVADRVCTWADEEGDVVVANGTWTGLTFVTDSPPFTAPVDLGGRVDAAASEQVTGWSGSFAGRWLMFGSNGAPVSNLPHAAGDRFLVVAAGTQSQGGALLEVGQAYTIRIRPAGEMALEEGIPGRAVSAGSVPKSDVGVLPSLRRPRQDRGPNQPPAILEPLEVTPVANDQMLPPGAEVGRTFQLRADGSLSITVTARDPDGDQLSCSWGGDPPTSQAPDAPAPTYPLDRYDLGTERGGYSVASPQLMNRSGDRYTSTVEWTPLDPRPGQWYTVGVVVDDLRGGRDAYWIVVQIIESGASRLAANHKLPSDQHVCAVANINGGERVDLPFGGTFQVWSPEFARDGRVMYVKDAAPDSVQWQLVDKDLQDFTPVIPPASSNPLLPRAFALEGVSPDGVHLLWRDTGYMGSSFIGTVYVSQLDGSNARVLGTDLGCVSYTPDGRVAAVTPGSSDYAFVVVDPRTGARDEIDTGLRPDGSQKFVSFTADASRVIYDMGVATDGTRTWKVREGGGAPATIPVNPGDEYPKWSPGGSRVAWFRGSQVMVADYGSGALANVRNGGEVSAFSVTWLDDRYLLVSRREGVVRWDSVGGSERLLIPDSSHGIMAPTE